MSGRRPIRLRRKVELARAGWALEARRRAVLRVTSTLATGTVVSERQRTQRRPVPQISGLMLSHMLRAIV
jgi:hypothetical protein